MSMETYKRLSPKGRRRAVAAQAVEGAIIAAGMFAAGYALCAVCYAIQVICGVAG